MAQTIKAVVKNRFDTYANLTAANDTPYEGEVVFESDTLRFKVGDGTTAYNSLPYSGDISGLQSQISTNASDISTNASDISTKITGSTDQIAKAWVNFNGTGTVAIRDSYNVSSITDNGTGNYTINFSNPMNDTNYSFIGTASKLVSASSPRIVNFDYDSFAKTTTQLQISIEAGSDGTRTDVEQISLSVYGS